jgi:hypothetical protein
MEPEACLLFSERPATGPYNDANESIPCPTLYFFKIYFNIILSCTPVFQAVSSILPTTMYACLVSRTRYMPLPAYTGYTYLFNPLKPKLV